MLTTQVQSSITPQYVHFFKRTVKIYFVSSMLPEAEGLTRTMCLPLLDVKRHWLYVISLFTSALYHCGTNRHSNCLVTWQKEHNNQASTSQHQERNNRRTRKQWWLWNAPFGTSWIVLTAYMEGRPDGCVKAVHSQRIQYVRCPQSQHRQGKNQYRQPPKGKDLRCVADWKSSKPKV